MANTISPNMNLIIPTVGSEAGPTYAFDVNTSLTLIDQHDHTPGKGVQIVSAALNINSDLDFQNHAAINLSRTVFQAQGSPSNVVQSLSVSSGSGDPLINDLWYTDSNGTQIQITENGQLAAVSTTVQGITYITGGTFVFTQTPDGFPTRPANLDAGSITLRPNTDGTLFGVTLVASGVSSAYSLVLPTVPGQQQFLTIDNNGNISGTIPTAQGITTSNIAPNTILSTNVENKQLAIPSTIVTTTYGVATNDGFLSCSTTGGGPFTITLYDPAAAPGGRANAGHIIRIQKNGDANYDLITIGTAGGNIDDATTTSISSPYEMITLLCDGANWHIVDRTYPTTWTPATFGYGSGFSYASQTAYIKRNGSNLDVRLVANNLNSNTGAAIITMPAGLAINTSVIDANRSNLGVYNRISTTGGAGDLYPGTTFPTQSGIVCNAGSSTDLFLAFVAAGSSGSYTLAGVSSTAWASGDGLTMNFSVPIAGWN